MSFVDLFWEAVCPYTRIFAALIGIQGMFFILLIFSFWMSPPDPYTQAITGVSFVIVLAVFVAAAYLLYRCLNRKQERRKFNG